MSNGDVTTDERFAALHESQAFLVGLLLSLLIEKGVADRARLVDMLRRGATWMDTDAARDVVEGLADVVERAPNDPETLRRAFMLIKGGRADTEP